MGGVPGHFVRWLTLVGADPLVAVVVWAINTRMRKKKPLPREARRSDQPDVLTID